MEFEYYRLLVIDNRQPEMYTDSQYSDRGDLLADVFSEGKEISFDVNNKEFTFFIKKKEDDIVNAIIGKKDTAEIYDPPSKNSESRKVETWPYCSVLMNLNDEKESGETEKSGQIIAFEVNNAIKSKRCLQKLTETINSTILSGSGYELVVNSISDEKYNFWSIIRENEGNIKSIKFSYYAPNLFGEGVVVPEEIKQGQDKYNATEVEVSIKNNVNGIKAPEDDDFLKQSAEYVEKGQGDFTIGVLDGKRSVVKKRSGDKTRTKKFNWINKDNLSWNNIVKILKKQDDDDSDNGNV